MHLKIEDLEIGVGEKKDKNIQIKISGGDIKFVATEYSVSLFLDEEIADKLAIQLSFLLEDRRRRKDLTKEKIVVE